MQEAIAKAKAAAEAAHKLLEAKLQAKAPPAEEPGADASAEGSMELDADANAEVVDALLATLDARHAGSGVDDGGATDRSELKRQLASVVARGFEKKCKSGQQCG